MAELNNLPVKIRGVLYPSQTIAAEVLGVKPSTICYALANGTEQFAGLGVNYTRLIQLEYKGKIYESGAALARATGLAYHHVNFRMSRARSEGLGSFDLYGELVTIIGTVEERGI